MHTALEGSFGTRANSRRQEMVMVNLTLENAKASLGSLTGVLPRICFMMVMDSGNLIW